MKFDWTVNFGHILTLVSLLVVLAAGYMNLVRRMDRIEANVDIMFRWFEQNVIGGPNARQARDQETRNWEKWKNRIRRDEEDR